MGGEAERGWRVASEAKDRYGGRNTSAGVAEGRVSVGRCIEEEGGGDWLEGGVAIGILYV